MAVHDQAELLEQNLPLFFSSQGETAYEVIVVDDSSADDTPDVLKRLKTEYPQLYSTFIPPSVGNSNRQRLALTIGAKAAHGEWVVLTDVSRPPLSETWIETMVEQLDSRADAQLVYPDAIFQSGETLEDLEPMVLKAERRSGNGHRGSKMSFRRGLYDAVIVKREHVHDMLKFFGQDIRGSRLMGLRMKVWWNNMF